MELKKIGPFFLAFAVVVLGVNAIARGFGRNLLFMTAGLMAGLPVLDLDKVLAKYLSTQEDFFHSFMVYILLFVLTVFVITASASAFGRGMVLALLFHGFTALKEQKERKIGAGLLGVAVLLLFL